MCVAVLSCHTTDGDVSKEVRFRNKVGEGLAIKINLKNMPNKINVLSTTRGQIIIKNMTRAPRVLDLHCIYVIAYMFFLLTPLIRAL